MVLVKLYRCQFLSPVLEFIFWWQQEKSPASCKPVEFICLIVHLLTVNVCLLWVLVEICYYVLRKTYLKPNFLRISIEKTAFYQ